MEPLHGKRFTLLQARRCSPLSPSTRRVKITPTPLTRPPGSGSRRVLPSLVRGAWQELTKTLCVFRTRNNAENRNHAPGDRNHPGEPKPPGGGRTSPVRWTYVAQRGSWLGNHWGMIRRDGRRRGLPRPRREGLPAETEGDPPAPRLPGTIAQGPWGRINKSRSPPLPSPLLASSSKKRWKQSPLEERTLANYSGKKQSLSQKKSCKKSPRRGTFSPRGCSGAARSRSFRGRPTNAASKIPPQHHWPHRLRFQKIRSLFKLKDRFSGVL